MTKPPSELLSIVVPVYNEQSGIVGFHGLLTDQLNALSDFKFEIIYCDDGSTDQTLSHLQNLADIDKQVRLIRLSRNFGKEIATTAGIHEAQGAATIVIDGDGQHPVELLPEFIERWRSGSKVVVGLRTSNQREGFIKRFGSKVFYSLFNKFTRMQLVPGASDFRLIDRTVRADFVRLTEHNRITRGLIDWLGYERSYIKFQAKSRLDDSAGYSIKQLTKLAVDSVISLSSSPLYITAYVGAVVLPLSILLGIVMLADKLAGDPLNWHATGGAYVSVLLLFLIGILMMSQGIIGLYLSHIHSETQNRPLYIIDREASVRL